MADFVQNGDSIDYTPASSVVGGDVIVIGDMVCVAKKDIAANALGAVARTGVFAFPKATGSDSAIAAGKKVYWNASSAIATETTSANKQIGYTVGAATDDDEFVNVALQAA